MALDPTVLANLIVTNVEAATGNVMPAVAQTVWQAVAAAIITHITTEGVVTVAVASVSGVTAGVGVSGPGAGTGTIT
jgi:hypothetical protein